MVELGSFYEKVVKVKADVAAILKFFLPMPQIEANQHEAAPGAPIGGGNPPATAFPRGKRERGCSDFLVAAGSSRWHSVSAGHPLVYCVLALLPRFSPLRSPNL